MGIEATECTDVVAAAIKDQESSGIANMQQLRALLDEQGYCCALCGVALDPDASELDHRIPRSQGGSDAASNLQWLCKPCNRAKGTMSNDDFIALCSRVHERKSRWCTMIQQEWQVRQDGTPPVASGPSGVL